jgi:hypothetical protein
LKEDGQNITINSNDKERLKIKENSEIDLIQENEELESENKE